MFGLTTGLETHVWIKLHAEPGELYKLLAHSATQVGSYLFIQGDHDGDEYISDMRFFNLGTFHLHLSLPLPLFTFHYMQSTSYTKKNPSLANRLPLEATTSAS
jgi:hypothetical protein